MLTRRLTFGLATVVSLVATLGTSAVSAQGTTNGAIAATVTDGAGHPRPSARVVAVHEPSGTRYEGRTRDDGRVTIPNMRIGGPYKVTVASIGLQAQSQDNVSVTLGQTTDLSFVLREAAVQIGEVTITGANDKIFSSTRTGASTAVPREVLGSLPTISGRLESIARLTPQSGGGMSFVGQDSRLNNITVDGSYFNSSFGLGNTPGDRTGVAPISLSAIEQIQVNVAPFDVRQGNFVGAAVNTVTRSGTNDFKGSAYYQYRNQSMIGTKAGTLVFKPGTSKYDNKGGWASGSIIPNKLFYFLSYEDELLAQPGTTFRANTGSETVAGNVTRVKASDLDALSAFLKSKFSYDPGTYQDYSFGTPAKRFLGKMDFNINDNNKLIFRFNSLTSNSDILLSNSSSLGFGTRRTNSTGLNFSNSNYKMTENIKSGVMELNSVVGSHMANNFIVGYTSQDESRANITGPFFPMVDIKESGSVYTTFGFEPFTPNNQLTYTTAQLQNNFTIYGDHHDLTFGVSAENYKSTNVFFSGRQSVYVYNSLADFYTDANDYVANPTRTTSPITLALFQVRWNNIPGQTEPVQPLKVFYGGVYAQDEWRATPKLKFTIGARMDIAKFGNTAFDNAVADALSFRDENGQTVHYNTGKLPDAKPLFSPRVGFNWDVMGNRATQFRGGSGVFTGPPAFVWISNQIGTTGVLTGFESLTNTKLRPFNPDPDHYKPATVTGAPASSYELAVTNPDFKFPQIWRTDVGVDQRLPFGTVGTLEYIYNRDINGVYYINANLAPANSAFTGPDARPRWIAVTGVANSNRINQSVQDNVVLKNQNVGRSWNMAASLEKPFDNGLFVKAGASYGEARNTVDPGSIAFGSWNNNQHPGDPNNPGLGFSGNSPGKRIFLATSYRKEYFSFGATSLSLFWEGRTLGNASYTYSGDLNGDGGTSNDLLYIPKDVSEMNFETFTCLATTCGTATVFSSADQATAWEAYIQQDSYLSAHRGQYAVRNATFLPVVNRADLSITQEVFTDFVGKRNSLQIRADILNVGNLLSKKWGAGQRFTTTQPLVVASSKADATGKALYRMNIGANGNKLLTTTFQPTAGIADVYRFQLGVRYTFN